VNGEAIVWREPGAPDAPRMASPPPDPQVEMAAALLRLGRADTALDLAREVLARDPRSDPALAIAADAMLRQGDAAGLIALLDDLAARQAPSTTWLACRANALAAAGDHEALAGLIDRERWCVPAMIGGGVDHDRLADAILSHPALATSPRNRATHGLNQRLDGLAGRGDPVIDSALALVRRRLQAYVEERRDLPHPLMAHRPAAAMLQGWALVTSEDGHEARHVHPTSWLTAVYYVRVPATEPRAAGPPPGSVVFGPWPAEMHPCADMAPGWHVEPRAGMLLIFPSFLAHRTVPTAVPEPRLCLSLDVIPA